MFIHFKYGYHAALLIMLGFLTACSGVKTYPNTLDSNLHVITTTDSGSVLTSVNASVEIYQVEGDCSINYAGTVQLDKPTVDIGIPTGRSSYLVFVFSSSGFLSSSSSSTSYSTLLRPRAGLQYDIDVSYLENIYNVVIHSKRPGSDKRQAIETRDMASCKPLKV